MCHGDDFGLVLPPALAPVQAVVVVVKDTDGEVARVAASLVEALMDRGVRVRLDDNVAQGFGWRATEWDLQGVPIRVGTRPMRPCRERGPALSARYPREDHRVCRQRR
jgi:prolyl-tRNA synthetase